MGKRKNISKNTIAKNTTDLSKNSEENSKLNWDLTEVECCEKAEDVEGTIEIRFGNKS